MDVLAISTDGRLLVSQQGGYLLLHSSTAKPVRKIKTGRLNRIVSFAIGPLTTWAGRNGVSASGGQVKVWDLSKGAIRWTPIVNENNLRQVAISPDGVYMAAVGERLHLVNLRTTEHEWTVPGNSPSHASFSPNSATLTASTLDKCRVFITAAGKQLRMLKPPTKATATASAFANDDVMMTVWQGTGNSGVRSVTAHRVMSGTLLAVSAAIMASGSIACGLGLIGTLDNGLLQTWDWGRNPGSKEETLRTFAFEVTGDDDATLLGYCNSPCPRIFALVLEKVRLRFGMPPELWVDVIARSRVYGKRAVLWLASLGTLKMVDVESGESILRRKLKVVEL